MTTPIPVASPRLSFIMPARDEEKYIADSIASVRRYCPEGLLCEIIVVDHGSRDRTREIAKSAGAIVLQPAVATIAALRNAGAQTAEGNVYVFLDADVTLTEDWRSAAHDTFDHILQEPAGIFGSNCDAPDGDNWFLKYWFRELAKDESSVAIGSAHLIVPKSLFERVGGFDGTLRTGEDYALCARAKALGAPIVPRPSLRTIHHGYPLTIRAFVRRERWHGLGDTASVQRAVGSKVVWMTLAFLGLHVTMLAAVFLSPIAAAVALTLLLVHLGISTRVRFPRLRGTSAMKAMAIFYLYYLGRSLSFFQEHQRGSR